MKHLFLLLLALSLFACGSKKENKQTEVQSKPIISVVNYPLYYFAERIGGEFIELQFPLPKDVDPAYWVPNSEELAIFQESDLILTNGANYAKWLNNVSLPERNLVNTTESAKDKYIEVQEGTSHSHGSDGEHVHMGLAFTTWLDFEIAIAQAKTIKDKLEKLLPNEKQQIGENFEALKKDLLVLDSKLKSLSSSEYIIGSHPVYQYLASAYKLKIKSVHMEPGEEPTKKQWHDFDHFLEHYPSEIMIWEDEPLKLISELVEIKGLHVVVFKPCSNKPATGDFLTIMESNISNLQQYLGKQ